MKNIVKKLTLALALTAGTALNFVSAEPIVLTQVLKMNNPAASYGVSD